MNLQEFEADLKAQHAKLTAEFEAEQVAAEAAWAKFEQKKAALVEFRSKYGKVLKALGDGAVEVK